MDYGEYNIHAYDTELKRTREVVISHKTCERCREQRNKCQEDNADTYRTYAHNHKHKKLLQEVDNATEQVCTICLTTKPKSDYGEYKTWAFTQDTSQVQEVMLPYKSCKGCRDKDKTYNTQQSYYT